MGEAAEMDETMYHELVGKTFRTIEDALAEVDPDLIEVSSTGDVLNFTFAKGARCVLNTQRPVRQLWLAARSTAWHFSWDAATGRWMDDKGRGDLTVILAGIFGDLAGVEVSLG